MRTITLVFIFTTMLSSLAVATLLYVELPDDISLDSIDKPNLEDSKRINETVMSAIKNWCGDTLNPEHEVFSIVMTRKGIPILPKSNRTLKNTETRGSLTFFCGIDLSEQAWFEINEHIVGTDTHTGAYRWLCWFYGYPLDTHGVRVNGVIGTSYYNISTREIYFYWESPDLFRWYDNWILDNLMLLAFRDYAYIDWAQFEVGMNNCVATLTQNKLDGDINSIFEVCQYAWHGGPGFDPGVAFDLHLGSEYYQMMNVKEIATNCQNFAGRNDYQPGSGDSQIAGIRKEVCSMFWFKIFKERPQLFVDFNNKLYEHFILDWQLYGRYTPPDYAIMMGWLRELMPSTVEGTNKLTWLNDQWIMKNGINDSAYNLLINAYPRAESSPYL